MRFFSNFPHVRYDFLRDGRKFRVQDFTRYVNLDNEYLDSLAIYQYHEIDNGARPDVVSSMLYNTPEYHWTFFLINDHLKKGYSEWPLSSAEFDTYIEQEYSSNVALEMNASIEGQDMFAIGTVITGSSGGQGTVYARDVQNFQVVLTDVTGTFSAGDTLTSTDPVGSWNNVAAARSGENGTHHWIGDDDGLEYNYVTVINDGISATRVTHLEYETEQNDSRRQIRVIKPEFIYEFANKYRRELNA